jgi:hypothetical protein
MIEMIGKEHKATNLQKMMMGMRTAGTKYNTAQKIDENSTGAHSSTSNKVGLLYA